jgi:sugar phosphate isomerase/epimerase
VRFGISTHLFHNARLTRDHLQMVADAGFDAVELFAVRSHFDYHDRQALTQLSGWLASTKLTLASVHAPIAAGLVSGAWQDPWSNASADAARRERSLQETRLALDIAATAPYTTLVLHLGVPTVGVPTGQATAAADNQRDAARRSLEQVAEHAAGHGVAIAIEVIPNELSTPEALVRLLENDVEIGDAGVCLDLGHAHLMGDVVDAVETLSGYLATAHVHDNAGRRDDHLLPFEGTIDWERALLALQKVGFDGPLMFELAATPDPATALTRAARARHRMHTLVTFDGHA